MNFFMSMICALTLGMHFMEYAVVDFSRNEPAFLLIGSERVLFQGTGIYVVLLIHTFHFFIRSLSSSAKNKALTIKMLHERRSAPL